MRWSVGSSEYCTMAYTADSLLTSGSTVGITAGSMSTPLIHFVCKIFLSSQSMRSCRIDLGAHILPLLNICGFSNHRNSVGNKGKEASSFIKTLTSLTATVAPFEAFHPYGQREVLPWAPDKEWWFTSDIQICNSGFSLKKWNMHIISIFQPQVRHHTITSLTNIRKIRNLYHYCGLMQQSTLNPLILWRSLSQSDHCLEKEQEMCSSHFRFHLQSSCNINLADMKKGGKNPNRSYRELTTDKIPLLVGGHFCSEALNLNFSDSTHLCSPCVLSIGSWSMSKSSYYISVALMSRGIDINMEWLLVIPFWRLNPPLTQSRVKSFKDWIASLSEAVDFRQLST